MWFLRYSLYLIVFIGFSAVHAGSYEDFFRAIKQDSASTIQSLLVRGFDPNTLDSNGQFGLILAVRDSSFKVATVLISHPATRVEVRTSQDESPLMLAALKGALELCEQLIARDADINKPGWTPLHYAATGGHEEVIGLLLKHHAYIDAESPNQSTPLMMAAMYGSTAAVRRLLEAGADPRIKNALGYDARDFARQGQRPDAVALLDKFLQDHPR